MSGLSPSERLQFFQESIFNVVHRFLSAMDRCPVSSSRGSLDREYWAWATKEFANMDMQRGVLVFAYVYNSQFQDNRFYKNPSLLVWIKWGIEFWVKRQSRQGAFDHLYPFENSWMATAFTLNDMVAVYELIGSEINGGLKEKWHAALRKAGTFLCRYNETHGFISNHRAGAAAALLGLFKLFSEQKWADHAWRIMDEVYTKQSEEGWFLEYEGADPGYQTLDTHYQARFYYLCDKDSNVLENVRKSIKFLQWFVHPDGSIGGEYGSRNCPHYHPGGIEFFSPIIPEAEAVASFCTKGLMDGSSCGLADVDIRNEVVMSTGYVYAAMALTKNGAAERVVPLLPWQEEYNSIVFHYAGIAVHTTANHHLIFGVKKGGVVKIFDKKQKRLFFSSCGYTAEMNGHDITTHIFHQDISMQREITNNKLVLSCKIPFCCFFRERLASPFLLLAFRMFNLTIGRIRVFNDFVRKNIIIGRYLKLKKPVGLFLHRSLCITNREVWIEDSFEGNKKLLCNLEEHGFFSTIYMASARYFRQQDFHHTWSSPSQLNELEDTRTGPSTSCRRKKLAKQIYTSNINPK